MRVLVLWADDRSANLGVRVLAAGTAELARRAWDNPEIVFQDFAPNASGFGLGGRTVLTDALGVDRKLRNFLSDFDVILDTGAGDSFADIYGIKRLAIMTAVQRRAQRLGIPIVQTPQTIGPFNSPLGRRLARRALRGMAAVMPRDSTSEMFASQLGARDRTVVPSTDVVFALPRPARSGDRDVIVNVSGLLWSENPHVSKEHYRSNILELIGALRDSGRSVSLLAHVLENQSTDNDVPALRDVAKHAGQGIEQIVPEGLEDARSVLAGARLVVGSRMHACLNALSAGTPSIPWAYSRKFGPLLRDLGWDHVIDLATDSSPTETTFKILREHPQEALESAVAAIVDQAEQQLKAAAIGIRDREGSASA